MLAMFISGLTAAPCQAADAGDAALTVSKKAYTAYKAGEYQQAAIMYRAAWHTNPKMMTYLYNAARAAQLAGALDDSERDYKLFIEKAPPNDPEVAKAWHHLGEIGESRAALKSPPRPTPPRAATPQPPAARAAAGDPKTTEGSDGNGRATAGWVLVAGGGGAVLAGALFLAKGLNDQSDLDALYKRTDPVTGKIIGVDHAQAQAENEKINSTLRLGYIVGGLGLAAVGVGAWLVSSADDKSAWLLPGPTARGLSVALRF